jgi:hypothetical protein
MVERKKQNGETPITAIYVGTSNKDVAVAPLPREYVKE